MCGIFPVATGRTFVVIHSRVAVLVQQLLHAAKCDGSEVARVFQLEEALQVHRGLTPSDVHALTVHRVQPRIKPHPEIKLTGAVDGGKCERHGTKGSQKRPAEKDKR